MAQTVSRMNHIFGTDGKTFILAMDHGSNFNVLPAMKDAKTLIRELAAAGADAFLSTIGWRKTLPAAFWARASFFASTAAFPFWAITKRRCRSLPRRRTRSVWAPTPLSR